MRRGVSKLFAIIVLVSIAIVMAIVASTYILNAFNRAQSYTTMLKFIDGDVNLTTYTLQIQLQSLIKPLLVVYRLEAGSVNINLSSCSVSTIGEFGRAWISGGKLYVIPGTMFVLTCPVPPSLATSETTVQVTIYTESGMVFRYVVPAG